MLLNGELNSNPDRPQAGDQDPVADLVKERLLMVRAQRKLIEHELTERRVLLALAVFLAITAAACAIAGLVSASIPAGLAGGGFATLSRVSRRHDADVDPRKV